MGEIESRIREVKKLIANCAFYGWSDIREVLISIRDDLKKALKASGG